MACATNADCAHLTFVDGNVSLPNWCVVGAQCDLDKAACVVWPRCRSNPYLGCLAANELCVTVRVEENPPPLSGSNLTSSASSTFLASAPAFLLPVLAAFLFSLVLFVVFLITTRRDCQRGKERHRQHEGEDTTTLLLPIVSIDGGIPLAQGVFHEQLTAQYNAQTGVY